MTTDFDSQREQLLSLLRDQSFQNEAAQLRAKALITEVSAETRVRWNYDARRMTRNATAAIFDLEVGGESSPDLFLGSSELQQASLRVAQLWESLSRLEEGTSRDTALMNASVAYQIAGYQANAACLSARLLDRSTDGLDEVSRLGATFMRRLFLAAIDQAAPLTIEPETVGMSQADLVHRASIANMARGITSASRYFLDGQDEHLSEAHRSLLTAERGLAWLASISEANTAHGLRSLLPIMAARSTWRILRDLNPENSRWLRYLKLLARGVGRDVFRSPSVSELWPSQLAALRAGLLTRRDGMIVRLPTSAGKTRIAELAMVHTLAEHPSARCLYIAPYRALVSELTNTFLDIFSDLGFSVSSFVGAYDADPFETRLALDASVLIMTPERLDLLLRTQPDFFESVRLVVLDEGQVVDDFARGPKYELLLSRLKVRLPDARFLFLSAVIPDQTMRDFAGWLKATPETTISSPWRPSVLRTARFEWRGSEGVIEYEATDDLEFRGEFLHGVIRQRVYEHVNPDTQRIRRPKFPDVNHKAQTAAELAVRFSEIGPVLVFCPQTNLVDSVADALSRRLDLIELVSDTMPKHFGPHETRSVRIAEDWLGADHSTTRLLRRGIAVHHGRLPDVLRTAIETDFRERRYAVLVATNTLAQGVNLPIRTVIVHSCHRRDADTDERISAREYWNIAGRAGRAGWETEGTVVHLVTTARDREDYRYFVDHRDAVEPVDSVLFKILKALINERIKSEDVFEMLEPDLLALMAEEDLAVTHALVESVLDQSLAAVQAARESVPMTPLKDAFRNATDHVVAQLPEVRRRRAFSDTGLGITSNSTLETYALEHRETIARLLRGNSDNDFIELAELTLELCRPLDEMQPVVEIAASYVDALRQWLRGRSAVELFRELNGDSILGSDSPSIEDFGRFITDFLSYKLPWGASAFIRLSCGALEIAADELSQQARFLPTMIKFGVPVPEAAWAMSAGIPLRRVAMDLATQFLRTGRTRDPGQFREWMSTIETDDLTSTYGLRGDALQDVSAMLGRSAPGSLTRDLRPIGVTLPLDVIAVGLSFGDRAQIAAKAVLDMPLELCRDYDNTFDRNAISLVLGGEELGFVPRAVAQYLAPELDSGTRLIGYVRSITADTPNHIQVRIAIE